MSSQKILIEDILSLYNTILEKRDMYETAATLRSTLSGLGYDEKGSELTSGGNVNDKLTDIVIGILKQFKTNYPSAKATLTSGNDKYHQGLSYKSQHTLGNAIDVALTPYDSKSASAFLAILNSTVKSTPGFTYIDEYTNPSKAATGGHYHLQYGTNTSNSQTNTSGTTSGTSTSTTTTDADSTESGAKGFAKRVGKSIIGAMGLQNTTAVQESFELSSFGEKTQLKRDKILIPKNFNSKIKSPVSGRIVDVISNSSCANQIVIDFTNSEETGYLEYCGISKPNVNLKDRVGVGTLLGTTNSNVTVTQYSQRKQKTPIDIDKSSTSNDNSNSKDKDGDDKDSSNYQGNNEYSKLLVKGYNKLKKTFDKPKKLDENIERIKGLIK